MVQVVCSFFPRRKKITSVILCFDLVLSAFLGWTFSEYPYSHMLILEVSMIEVVHHYFGQIISWSRTSFQSDLFFHTEHYISRGTLLAAEKPSSISKLETVFQKCWAQACDMSMAAGMAKQSTNDHVTKEWKLLDNWSGTKILFIGTISQCVTRTEDPGAS